MKKVFLLLLLWVSVSQLSYAQGFCNNQSFLSPLSTSLGSPLDGPYKPCEEVLFCYNVIGYNSQGCNWLHGIVPDFGDCWDETSFSPFFAGLPNDILNFPTNNSGYGEWLWYEDGEITYNSISPASYPPGAAVGAGWFYNNYTVGPTGTNAGDTWGDGFVCNSQGLTWSFCFSLVTECEPDCDINGGAIDCQVSIKTFSDGETGGRSQADCVFDQSANFDFNINCCEKPVVELQQTYSICSGESLVIDFPVISNDLSYYWSLISANNIGGAGNGGGIRLEQTLTNFSQTPQEVVYSVTPINGAGDCTGDPTLITIIVAPAMEATILGQPLACFNQCVDLFVDVVNAGPNPLYTWSDGTVSGGGFFSDCSGIFEATTYTVTISDGSTGCSTVASYTVEVAPVLFVSAGEDQELTCGESSVTLDAFIDIQIPGITVSWFYQGAAISSDLSVTVSEPGSYFLLVNDVFGCLYTDDVVVTENLSLAGVDAGPDVYLPCGATNIGLNATDGLNGLQYVHEWSTIDGNILFDGNTLFPTVEAGTYFLTTTNIENGCSGVDEVVVSPSIAGIVTQGAALDCNTTSITLDGSASSGQAGIVYQWSTQDGNIVNGANTTMVEVDAPGTYTLMVTDTLENCTATAETVVANNAIAPIANAGGNQAISCLVSTPILDAGNSSSGAGISLAWTGPNGFSSSLTSIIVDIPGVYELLVTNNDNGCTATDQVVVSEDLTPPVADAGGVAYLNCFNGETTLLDASNSTTGSNITYEWSDPLGVSISNGPSPTATANLAGNYFLIVVDNDNGCSDSDGMVVEDFYSIDLTTTEVNCEEGDGSASLTLVGINDPVYNWSNGETGASLEGLAPGDYSVTIAGANGTCEEVRDFTIEADLSCKVIIGGYAYADFIINNCELDDLEEGLEGLVVNLEPLGISTLTDETGYYEFEVNTGDYTIEIEEQEPYILQCPIDGMISVSLPDTSDVSVDNNFYFQVITDFDLIISANSSTPIPGQSQNYSLNYCNFGIQTINGILRFTHDPQLIFDPVIAGASSYDPETYTATWNFTNLPFLTCNSINFKMEVPSDLPIGTSLVSTAIVTPTIGDLNPGNNSKTWTKTVQASSSTLVIGNNQGQTKFKKQAGLMAYPNFPNPFDDQTTLAFNLPESDAVTITIFDIAGKVLRQQSTEFGAGYNEVSIDGRTLQGQGILFYRIETSKEALTGKMMKR